MTFAKEDKVYQSKESKNSKSRSCITTTTDKKNLLLLVNTSNNLMINDNLAKETPVASDKDEHLGEERTLKTFMKSQHRHHHQIYDYDDDDLNLFTNIARITCSKLSELPPSSLLNERHHYDDDDEDTSKCKFDFNDDDGKVSIQNSAAAAAQRQIAIKTNQVLIARTSKTNNNINNNNNNLLLRILLPFIILILLPSLKVNNINNKSPFELATKQLLFFPTSSSSSSSIHHLDNYQSQQQQLTFSSLLLTLIKFPFDRFRLTSGLITLSLAKEINSKHDLQEEETLQALQQQQAAEHRSGGGINQRSYHHHQQHHPSSSSSSSMMRNGQQNQAVIAPPPPDQYGSATSADDSTSGGMAPIEGTAISEPQSSSAIETRSDLPAVRALNVKCEKNHMTVNIVFDRPFYGMVFSKGHYNDQKCIHLPANSGQTSINFDIHLGKCGMSSSDASGGGNNNLQNQLQSAGQNQQPNGLYIENTIIIQYDPQVQEIYDQARKLRCTWYDYYEKSVTFRPYNVDMLDAVTANFLGDNIQCWMQIQVGKGPWSSEVAGIVKIGQTMTMVLAIKDDENRFDMLVRNCVAHDGKHQPIQLVDEYGCVARPKIMAKFQKVRNFGPAATVVSYAHFQAFKFPDSMSVHFQCVIQVCRYECPEPVCNQQQGGLGGNLISNDGGGAGGGPNSGGGTDYAASGTEIISSKEPMPMPLSTSGNAVRSSSNVGGSSGNSINLKLDESQGRVQVKLDTSMMAGLQNSGRAAAASTAQAIHTGPLPPHLLHQASTSAAGNVELLAPPPSTSARNAANYAPPYYRQATGGASGGSGGGRPTLLASSGRTLPSGSGQQHNQHHAYSPQYPTSLHHRGPQSGGAMFLNRLGDVDIKSEQQLTEASAEQQQSPDSQPLTLIASPRALRTPANVSGLPLPLLLTTNHQLLSSDVSSTNNNNNNLLLLSNHRLRRSIKPETSTKAQSRDERSSSSKFTSAGRAAASLDSTAIQTQKTIQVVSPDDVAFSLLSPQDEMDDYHQLSANQLFQSSSFKKPQTFNNNQQSSSSNNICFSATRMMFAILVTLITLTISVVIVVYFVLKQRAAESLEEKLSNCYINRSSPPLPTTTTAHHETSSPPSSSPMSLNNNSSLFPGLEANLISSAGNESFVRRQQQQQILLNEKELISQRQRAEIQQRNNYLARLYSQFVPAAYWQR